MIGRQDRRIRELVPGTGVFRRHRVARGVAGVVAGRPDILAPSWQRSATDASGIRPLLGHVKMRLYAW